MEYIDASTCVFANLIILKYHIDDSHGIDHARSVASLAADIVNDITQSQINKKSLITGLDEAEAVWIIANAAFVHDLIDQKYVDNVGAACEELAAHFNSIGCPPLYANYIIQIITHISFSKRLARKHQGLPLIDMAEVGYPELQLATEIVCDADMLDAYDPNRCITYKCHQMKRSTADADILRHVKLVLVERVLKYRKEYLNTDAARRMAYHRHKKLKVYVREKLAHIDITGLTYESNVWVPPEK